MKLATRCNGTPDGELIVVSRDNLRCKSAGDVAATLQYVLENWASCESGLSAISDELNAGGGDQLDLATLAAPLPRAWQWLDGSVYDSHGRLLDKVFGVEKPKSDRPLMYQGTSDRFYAPTEDVVIPDESLGIDFEGEFGVIVDAVPMGTDATNALKHIRLLVQINDWSLRTLAAPEMKTGFGWIQAKPVSSMAPFAVTPDELGDEWRNGRICCDLLVDWNGERFGAANGEPMSFGFHDLVAHAARTRNLVAGTVIGSGTVSNDNFRECGSSCIAERRGIEMLDEGEAKTEFMRFGDTVRMEGKMANGESPFGCIDQRVVPL